MPELSCSFSRSWQATGWLPRSPRCRSTACGVRASSQGDLRIQVDVLDRMQQLDPVLEALLERRVPQVGPEHGRHAQLMGFPEGARDLLDLAGAFRGSEIDR